MSYIPYHVHTYYSILDGFGSPKANVARAKKLGLSALGISDHGNVFGHIAHWTECKKAKIKPILGVELYVTHKSAAIKEQDNRANCHMVCWAKNKDGWLNLMKLVSKTNDPEYYYYKPRISLFNWTDTDNNITHVGLEHFVGRDKGIMSFSGHQGSHLADNLFCDLFGDHEQRRSDIKRAYGQYKERDIEFYRKFLKEDWLESTCELAEKMEGMFGKGNFFIELQNELKPTDRLALWIHPLIVECLREVSKQTGIPAMASSDPHYPSPEDAADQRLMVMTNMKETEASVQGKLDSEEGHDVMVFFGSDNFYIHSYDEMKEKFTEEELAMTVKVGEQIEEFDISHKPYIPKYDVPEFDTTASWLESAPAIEDKYLVHLCIEGAKKLKPWLNDDWKDTKRKYSKEQYWKRLIEQEFPVIFKAQLSSYFLIVWDYCMAADNRPIDHSFNWKENLAKGGKIDPIPRGVGRGSAAGCLISYLIGITDIDPILYDLSFTRFYSEGRNTADHIEYPDIDSDFAVEDREWVIAYLEDKYGKDNVAQIITFQRIQGKAAVKDIFRVKNVEGGFDLSNEICKYIPGEAEIADDIQAMRDAGHEGYGILRWALDNSEKIQEYYTDPKLKPLFDQAVRCEGTKRGQGRHPSGVIVAPKPVEECFPMALDTKTKEKIIAVDMNEVAKLGGIKMDILGVAILDKLKMAQDLVNGVTPRRNRINDYIESDDTE
jgi:DNA polymerase-3 subunit alpha